MRALVWVTCLLFTAAILPAALAMADSLTAQPSQQAGSADLVVDLADGRAMVRRVAVPGGAPMSGLDLLSQSGISLTLSGGAVCAIEGVGCPATDCFCACRGQVDCRYWYYHHGVGDGGWEEAPTGPAQYTVTGGAVEGWVWGGERPPLTATAGLRGAMLGWDWLRRHQSANGSMADHVGLTSEAVFAARSVAAASLADEVPSMRAFLLEHADAYSKEGVAQIGKLMAGIAASHGDPWRLAGVSWPERLHEESRYNAATGQFGSTVWDQAWAILGLRAAAAPIHPRVLAFLTDARSSGGGWGLDPDAAEADADSTGLALQAMIAAGAPVTSTAVAQGLAFLDATQLPDGGWGHGGGANVNSTAYALQGLVAAGENPAWPRWTSGQANPLRFLLGQQRVDGHLQYDAYPADLVATLQATPALAGRAQPMASRGVAATRVVDWIRYQQRTDGSFSGANPGATVDAVIAGRAFGQTFGPALADGPSPEDYLAGEAMAYAARGPAAAGKLLVGFAALHPDADFHTYRGMDLVGAVLRYFDPVSGTFGAGGTWDQSWAILGLAAARQTIPAAATAALLAASATDGGWGFDARAEAADPDSTGLALQALHAAGVPIADVAVRRAVTALHRMQGPDAGWGFDGVSNVNSTAMALGGLLASGQVVEGPGWLRQPVGSASWYGPLDVLLAKQSPEGGFAGYTGTNDPGASYAAALALSGRAMPILGWGGELHPLYLPALRLRR